MYILANLKNPYNKALSWLIGVSIMNKCFQNLAVLTFPVEKKVNKKLKSTVLKKGPAKKYNTASFPVDQEMMHDEV